MSKPAKPTHYEVLCVSLYTADIERAAALVAAMKARGFTKASRSMVIRLALAHLDLDKVLTDRDPNVRPIAEAADEIDRRMPVPAGDAP